MTETSQPNPMNQYRMRLTTQIVTAYISNHPLPTETLSHLIQSVYTALDNGGGGAGPAQDGIVTNAAQIANAAQLARAAQIEAEMAGSDADADTSADTEAMDLNTESDTAALSRVQQLRPTPEMIKQSIGEDYLICFEDGQKMTMLKRYIAKRFGLSPEQYRHKWGLPYDYPMVAPAYARHRSKLAKQNGLGRKRNQSKLYKTAMSAKRTQRMQRARSV